MRKLLLLAATAVVALGASQALSQEKKQLVIVVKGLDNPFFTVLGGVHGESFALEACREGYAKRGFVFDEQDAHGDSVSAMA